MEIFEEGDLGGEIRCFGLDDLERNPMKMNLSSGWNVSYPMFVHVQQG